jgi:hypothetical protein
MRSYRLGAALALTLAACSFDRRRSPVCGFELLAGPRLIQDRLNDARALLTDAPRGLPDVLPARVAGQSDTAHAIRGAAQGQLALVYEGTYFPPGITDSTVYGLLVVDDSSERVIGLLVYEGIAPPKQYPRIGVVAHDAATVPLFGVRVNWASIYNPRCPLLGSAPP